MKLDIYNLDAVEQALAEVPPFHQVAFAASCCERLLPNYSAFYQENQRVKPDILRSALDEVWQILKGKRVDIATVRQLIVDCEDLVPSGDDGGMYIYQAQCAAMAINYTLEACLDPDIKLVVKVVQCVGDTIDEFIRLQKDIFDPSWNEKPYKEQIEEINNHLFTVREMAKQNDDLQRLKKVETLDQDLLEWLRTSSNNNDKSLIDLS